MTKIEVFKILNLIEKQYPLVTFKSGMVLRWMDICGSMDYSIVLKKLILHRRINPYPPMLKEIIASSSNEGAYFEWLDEYTLRLEE